MALTTGDFSYEATRVILLSVILMIHCAIVCVNCYFLLLSIKNETKKLFCSITNQPVSNIRIIINVNGNIVS